MNPEKHQETLVEVFDTIEKALKDERGLLVHQRRLMAMISLGASQLVELYFHKLRIIKPGSQIKHDWFGSSERKLRLRLQPLLTKPIDGVDRIDEVIGYASKIEGRRNEIVYGAPLEGDKELREKIDLFISLKETVEELTGEKVGPQ